MDFGTSFACLYLSLSPFHKIGFGQRFFGPEVQTFGILMSFATPLVLFIVRLGLDKCRLSQCFFPKWSYKDPKLPKHQLNKFSFQLTTWNWTYRSSSFHQSVWGIHSFIKCWRSSWNTRSQQKTLLKNPPKKPKSFLDPSNFSSNAGTSCQLLAEDAGKV